MGTDNNNSSFGSLLSSPSGQSSQVDVDTSDDTMDASQYDNIGFAVVTEETESSSGELPDYFQTLLEGNAVCGDSRCTFAKPEWYDPEKFHRGQQFGVKYSFGIMYADLLSLFILFSFKGGLEPLIFTGKSDTPFKAFRRYLSTAVRVNSWYETDIWDETSEGHKNLKVVRGMHESVRHRMTASSEEEVAKSVTLENGKGTTQMWTTLYEDIQEDLKSSCPVTQGFLRGSKHVHVSQTDMAMTQFGFLGLILVFPKMFGVHGASEKDLEGFAHFWRTIGYLLGIEDRFNFCNGSLDVVRQRCQDTFEYTVKPSFRSVSRDWIHMSRCLTAGISYYISSTTFEVLFMHLCTVLTIATPRLLAALTFWQKCFYYYTLFLYSCVLRLPGMLAFHTLLIHLAMKKAKNMSPEKLRVLEQRVYKYQENPGAICTRL